MRTPLLAALLLLPACELFGGGEPTPDAGEAEVDAGSPQLPSATPVQVVLGRVHTCALTSTGAVRCWGENESGQLGLESDTTNTPAQVVTLTSGVKALAASNASDFTCALLGDGTVKCWGNDGYGQLGAGRPITNTASTNSFTPLAVAGLSDVRAIAAGQSHACALLGTGHVKCWGDNDTGQLGNDTTTRSNAPVEVLDLVDATALAAGWSHSCAVTARHTVACWGEGRLRPVEVPMVSTAEKVFAGYHSTCVITTSGGTLCWGDNTDYQLGQNPSASEPTAVMSLTANVTHLAMSSGVGCAITAGKPQCWGDNWYGQLGNDTGPSFQTWAPVDIVGLTSGATAVALGLQNTCVIAAGQLKCWGAGWVGNGNPDSLHLPFLTPEAVVSLP
ncbi:MAG: RCC1 domain-containing protein [Myxococcota bacterium]